MSLLIYINEELLEVSPRTVFALTLTKIDTNRLDNRFVNYTNSISIPFTQNNNRIFGNAQDENSDTLVPYQYLNCRVVQNGYEIIQDGRATLTESEDDYKLVIYENVVNIFDTIRGKSLRDINAIPKTGWLAPDIDSLRLATSDVVTVLLSWGKPGAIYQFAYFLPCFYYHSIVRKILQSTGLTLSGSILSDSNFNNLVIPYPAEDFLYTYNIFEANLAPNGPLNYSINSTPTLIASYNSPVTYDGNGNARVSILYAIISAGDSTQIEFTFYKNGVLVDTQVFSSSPTISNLILSDATDLLVGDVYEVFLSSDSVSIDVDMSITTMSIEVEYSIPVTRSDVYWNNLLEGAFTCDQILLDFFTRFGVIFNEKNGVLILKTLDEVLGNRHDVNDWTGKIVKDTKKKRIVYKSEYLAKNYFRYKSSPEVESIELGQGVLTTTTAEDTQKTIITSLFANSITDIVSGAKVGVIPVFDASSTTISEFANDPGVRLMTLKNRTTEPSITFNSIARTDYKLGYFIDTLLPSDTSFQFFLDNYYRIFKEAIDKSKVVTKYYELTDGDIADYDPLKMVRDEEGYYLVYKVNNYVSGEITKVELLKVG